MRPDAGDQEVTRAGDRGDRQVKYLRALRRHASIGDASRVAGIRHTTVWKWRREDPAFADDEDDVLDALEAQGRFKRERKAPPPAWVIRRLRAWLGVSNVKLAEVFGVSPSAISKTLERDDPPTG